MHVALLTNSAWLDDELTSFKRLVVGLIDEQVRVAQVMPQQTDVDNSSVFGERITWNESRWSFINRFRLGKLDTVLEELEIDVIHALDGKLWSGAAKLGESLDVPVVFTANCSKELARLGRLMRKVSPTQAAFSATTEPMVQAIRELVDPAYTVTLTPPGVHPVKSDEHAGERTALCAVVSGDGIFDEHYQALLNGIARFSREQPQCQFFFDGRGSDQHQIWQAASRLGLLGNLSLVPRGLSRRELLVRADVFLQPQPAGRSRWLTLQAMAHGVPVIAREDPWLDYLIDGETAWLVRASEPRAWHEQLTHLVEQPASATELGKRSRQWISQHRLASHCVTSILELYRRVTGESIKFPTEAAS